MDGNGLSEWDECNGDGLAIQMRTKVVVAMLLEPNNNNIPGDGSKVGRKANILK